MIVDTVMAFRVGAGDFIPSYFVRDLGMTSMEAGTLFATFLGSSMAAHFLK